MRDEIAVNYNQDGSAFVHYSLFITHCLKINVPAVGQNDWLQ
jgi:hypothetical protein